MSDFLTRLARITHGSTHGSTYGSTGGEGAVVTPRLPGRYAPIAGAGLADFAGPGVPQRDETELARAAIPSGTDWNANAEALSAGPSQVLPRRRRMQAAAERLDADGPNDSHRSAGDIPLVNPPANAAGRAPVSSRIRSTRDVAGNAHRADFGQPSSARLNGEPPAPGTAEIDPPQDSASDLNPFSRHSTVGRPPPLVAILPSGRGERQPFLARAKSADKSTAPQVPDVHINIGRIEVRAHAAAPKAVHNASRPEPQSGLSLQDYLQRGRRQDGRS